MNKKGKLIMRRVLLSLAASLSALMVFAIALPPDSASAASPTTVACGSLSLTGTAQDTLAKCDHTGITGSGGGMELAAGYFTITWKTKGITSGDEVPTEIKQSQCPKSFKSELKLFFTVTYSTNKSLLGGETTNFVCIHSDGAGKLLPGTKFTI